MISASSCDICIPKVVSDTLQTYQEGTWNKVIPTDFDRDDLRHGWELATTLVKIQIQELLEKCMRRSIGNNGVTVTLENLMEDMPNWVIQFAYELTAVLCDSVSNGNRRELITFIS